MTVREAVELDVPTTRREIATLTVMLVVASIVISWLTAALWNYTHGPYRTFDALLIQWDSGWYRSLVAHGYSRHPIEGTPSSGQANWAFFPLYPAIVWVVTTVSGVPMYLSGIITSITFLGGTIYISYLYIRRTRNESVAFTAVFLIALGPYSFYFITMYTESLFVFLIAAGFYCLSHERWLWAGGIGALLSATRGTGVSFGIPLLLAILMAGYSSEKSLQATIMGVVTDGRKVTALAVLPLGLFLFMLHLYVVVGDALAFMHVQRAWGRSFGNPLLVLSRGLTSHQIDPTYMTVCTVGGICVLLYHLYQRRVIESVFGLLLVLIPLASGLNSMPRYIVGSLVFIFALNDIVNKLGQYRWVVIAVILQYNILLLYLWYSAANLVN